MNTTTHYQLRLMGGEEQPNMSILNQNLTQMDALFKRKPDLVSGRYSGDSQYPRTIELGFQPRALLLFTSNGTTNSNGTQGGLLLPDMPLRISDNIYVSVVATGFLIHQPSSVDYFGSNLRGITYYYLALR